MLKSYNEHTVRAIRCRLFLLSVVCALGPPEEITTDLSDIDATLAPTSRPVDAKGLLVVSLVMGHLTQRAPRSTLYKMGASTSGNFYR
eukprot:4579351-Amphidinium_carterae.1